MTGQDWHTRGKRMDEMIEIIRGLTAGGFYEFHGRHYDIPSIKICPVPTEPIPILIGGHAEPALRRAARLGDGWMHAGSDDLEHMIRPAHASCARSTAASARRSRSTSSRSRPTPSTASVTSRTSASPTSSSASAIRTYEPIDSQTLQQKLDLLRQYADTVIPKTG